jgi:hypothetical protein
MSPFLDWGPANLIRSGVLLLADSEIKSLSLSLSLTLPLLVADRSLGMYVC